MNLWYCIHKLKIYEIQKKNYKIHAGEIIILQNLNSNVNKL